MSAVHLAVFLGVMFGADVPAASDPDNGPIIIMDEAPPAGTDVIVMPVEQAPPAAAVIAPQLRLGLASRLSVNVSGNPGDSTDVQGLEWWNLARARASLRIGEDLQAVFEGWVRWGMTGAPPQSGAYYGVNVRDVYWQSDVQLREASLRWNLGPVTLRAGQQLYAWGKNEFGAPADVINPYDLRYDLFAAFSSPKDMRVPVWSVDATYHAGWGDIGVVLLPFFAPHRVFLSGHDVSLTSLGGPYATALRQAFTGFSDAARDALQQGLLGTDVPDAGPQNFSVAARATGSAYGWDWGATGYFGWDRTPWLDVDGDVRTLAQNANALRNNPQTALSNPTVVAALASVQRKTVAGEPLAKVTYRHIQRFALEAETAIDPFVLRVDAGYTPSQTFYTQSLTPVALQDFRLVAGLDYLRGDALLAGLGAFFEPVIAPPQNALLLGLEASDASTQRAAVWLYGIIANLRWIIVDEIVDLQALATLTPEPLNYLAFAQVSYLGWAPHNLALGALFIGGRAGTAGADFAHDRFAMLQYTGAF